ncbi:obscurin isoform X2 [Myripristis murdjan]|uniref:obscurin isoform X2 n=1 Tax=Myripristis murdjan TaxID=586833 RepID=UPI0011763BF8|nr:obscurin-like isoform X2 [Myripristis murdjan]
MFTPAKPALLSRHLLFMVILILKNSAGFHSKINGSNKQVSTGDSVTLDCNVSEVNAKQVNWNKDRVSLFSRSLVHNKTQRNFTSDRMSIDPIIPTKLEISNVHQDDAGIYCCSVVTKRGMKTTEWNLTVSERESPKEISSPSSFPCLYPLVIGLVLSAITCSTVLLYRKLRTRATSQDP